MVRQGTAGGSGRKFCGVEETGEDDSTRALDVVVEERVAVAESVKEREGLRAGELTGLDGTTGRRTLSVEKSSNWMSSSGNTTDISCMNSSMNSCISA